MSKSNKPKKWLDVYPQGTKEGDEEQKFFISLARHPKWEWRSVSAISKETGLTKKRVEEIIAKYSKKGMVVPSSRNEDHWGYWERVGIDGDSDDLSITGKDQKGRIDKALNKDGGYVDLKSDVSYSKVSGYNNVGLHERWSFPTTDEDICLPIRPNQTASDFEYFAKKFFSTMEFPKVELR